MEHATIVQRQRAFGYTDEDLRFLIDAYGDQRGRADRIHGHGYAARLSLR